MNNLLNLVSDIVKAMGEGWTVKKWIGDAVIVTGETSLNIALEKERLYISADYGTYNGINESLAQYRHAGDPSPGISIGITKTPAAIAKDIKKRAVPPIKTLLEELINRKNAEEEHTTTSVHNATKLIVASGGSLEISSYYSGKGQIPITDVYASNRKWMKDKKWYLKDSFVSGNKVDLDIKNLPIDLAIQIVLVLTSPTNNLPKKKEEDDPTPEQTKL